MIKKYFRPSSLDEAVKLLSVENATRKPLGGGTHLSRQQEGVVDVVDLQNAGLNTITKRGQNLAVGSMVHLSELLTHPDVHPEVQQAILIDASENTRNMATLGGWLVTSDGRSVFTTVLLALDSQMNWEPSGKQVCLGDWLPLHSLESPGVLITEIEWQLGVRLTFEYVARSPKDRPILVVAAAQWKSGRTRIALGGYGEMPILAMDGPNAEGAEIACRDAYYEAEDQWSSALYRREVAPRLVLRCLDRFEMSKESED